MNDTVIFWQNIVSPHQVSLLRELSKNRKVILIAEEYMYGFRSNMGWAVEEITEFEVIITSDKESWRRLASKYNGVNVTHIVSGLMSFKLSAFVLKSNLPNKYIMAEAPNQNRYFVVVKYIRDYVLSYLHAQDVKGFLCIGHQALSWFKFPFLSKKSTFHSFSYCVESAEEDVRKRNAVLNYKDEFVVCFVGSLIPLKRVDLIIRAFLKADFGEKRATLKIIGSGPEEARLQHILSESSNENKFVFFLGLKKQHEVYSELSRSNALVLASRHDGWGAVTNEALQMGCQVIISNRCGSRSVVNEFNGFVFQYPSLHGLKNSLELASQRSSVHLSRKISDFYNRSLSDYALASYLLKIIDDEKMQPPWE
jgi:glycosyltransferase involved in cell wall biosynthesis